MLGVLVGWYLRRWWEKRKAPRPDGVYQGTVTLSTAVAGPMRRECKISEPLDETGLRKVLEDGPQIEPRSDWLATFKDKENGPATVRFSGLHTARDTLMESDVGDEYRLELYRTKRQGERVARPAPWEQGGDKPFGTPFGGGGFG